MRRRQAAALGTGLEGAPDIMLLTMAALMVAIVWLVSHVDESTLPPVDLPTSDAAALGGTDATAANVTLRPDASGVTRVWIEERPLEGGLDALENALGSTGTRSVVLRAAAATPWQDTLSAMTAAAHLGLPISVAAEGPASEGE